MHFLAFLVAEILFLFLAEDIIALIMPGFYDVNEWIATIFFGTMILLTITILSCIVIARKQKIPHRYTDA